MALRSFFVEESENSQSFFLNDAFVSITRAWGCIDNTQPETLAMFDALMKEAEERSISFFLVVAERDISLITPVASLCIGNTLFNWKAAAPNFGAIQETLRLLWKVEDNSDSKLLDHIIYALDALAKLAQEKPPSSQSLKQTTEHLQQAASELDPRDKDEEAMACAMSAINLAGVMGLSEGAAACSFALSLAKRRKNQTLIFPLLSQRAHFLAKLAALDPARRLDAFDAIETALAHVPANVSEQDESMLKILEGWINEADYLRVLRPMLLVVSGSEQLSNSIHREGIATAVNTFWYGNLPEWIEHFNYIQALSVETANVRAALMPKTTSSIRAIWNTWTIEHTRLRRAIPHGTSIKREQFLHDILLEISHEVTHVFSMFGFVGITLTAMRWALPEAELDVWGRIYYRQGKAFEEGFRITTAPLKDPDLISLGFAERTAEIERKIQLVENTWAPWFEGLAAFGELTSDPELDKEWQSPVAASINNLWDRSIASQAEAAKISIQEEQQRDQVETDALIAAAIHSRGEFRLRTYLTRTRQKYLAGYLAVRSVVSQWRKTLATPLRGDQAFRVLLHMTRFGDFAAFPDLGLPVEEFEKEVVTRHIEWMRTMSAVSRSDLEEMLKQDQSPRDERKTCRWVNGSLKTSDVVDEEYWEIVKRLADQCLASLVGERAKVERVPEADEVCQAVMAAVAEGLQGRSRKSRMLEPEIVQEIFSRLVILPLAQTSSTFWLCEKDQTLVCMICSREQDSESGNPSYDLLTYPLNEEEFLSLKAKVQNGGPRRITTTRVIDLLDYKERYVGTNFIVFRYEDWTLIQPRGVLFGLTTVDESLRSTIISRLSPNQMIQDQEALTSESHPCVQRTLAWIEQNDWTNVDTEHDFSVDIHAWAQRVRQLCKQVLSDNIADVEKTSQALLRFAFGDSELAKTLETQGLEALANADPPLIQDFIKALLVTAKKSFDDEDFASLNESISSILGPIFERGTNGWDVVSPQGIARKGA